jgi:hypothetical protein
MMTLSDAVELNDALSFLRSLPVLIHEGIRAQDSHDILGRYHPTIADGILCADLSSFLSAINALIQDGVSFSDALDVALSRHLTLGEMLTLGDTLLGKRLAQASASDGASVNDVVSALRTLYGLILDSVVLGGVLTLPTGTYNAWIINTQSLGVSRYTNYNFNSVAGRFAAADDGIYELTGDTDAGIPIPALIETGLMDFGSQMKKQIPDVYLGSTVDGRLVLKVTTSQDGKLIEDWYTATLDYEAPDNSRMKVGRGLKSRYWKFRLENVNGADFTLDDMGVRTVVLTRRL